MDINIVRGMIKIEIEPSQQITMNRTLVDEEIEKRLKALKDPPQKELDKIAMEQAKPTPLEQQATDIIRRSLVIMYGADARFMVVGKYGDELSYDLDKKIEIGTSTTISFTSMPDKKSKRGRRLLNIIGEAIELLDEGGLLEVKPTFRLKEEE